MEDNYKISIFEGKLVYVVKKSTLVSYIEQNDYTKEDLKREIYHVVEERKLLSIRKIIYKALTNLTKLDVYPTNGRRSLQSDPLFLELDKYIHQQSSYKEYYNLINKNREESRKQILESKKQKKDKYYFSQRDYTKKKFLKSLFK